MKSAVVTFNRDEFELLSDWIQYHAEIFGFENLHIIDHISTTPAIQNLLHFAESMGSHVIYYEGSWQFKGAELSRVMHEVLDTDPSVQTIIPLDVDEFVVGQQGDENTWTTSPDVILDHIDKLPRDGFKYKFGNIKVGACSEGEVAIDRSGGGGRRVMTAMYFSEVRWGHHYKTFFDRHGFNRTDDGNHFGFVEADSVCDKVKRGEIPGVEFFEDQCFHYSPLAVAHYGISALSYPSWVSKMQVAAEALNFTLESECVGIGSHYCEALKTIEADPEGSRHCNRNCMEPDMPLYYGKWIASAVMGERGEIMKYSSAKEWPGSCE